MAAASGREVMWLLCPVWSVLVAGGCMHWLVLQHADRRSWGARDWSYVAGRQ